jgi:hypothetical protein
MDAPTRSVNPAVRAALIVDIVIGFWIIISPFVFSIPANDPVVWSNIASGIAVIVVVLVGGLMCEAALPITVPLGVWIFASAVLFKCDLRFVMNNILTTFALTTVTAMSDGLRVSPPARTPSL